MLRQLSVMIISFILITTMFSCVLILHQDYSQVLGCKRKRQQALAFICLCSYFVQLKCQLTKNLATSICKLIVNYLDA